MVDKRTKGKERESRYKALLVLLVLLLVHSVGGNALGQESAEPAPAEGETETAAVSAAVSEPAEEGEKREEGTETGAEGGDSAAVEGGLVKQEGEKKEEKEGGAKAAAKAGVVETAAAAGAGDEGELGEMKLDPLKEELEQYWTTEGRRVKTIENRIYNKDGRFVLSLLVGMEATDPFWWYLNVGLRATYNFTEVHGLELAGAYHLGFATALQKYLKKQIGASFDPKTDLKDKTIFRVDLAYVWRPFYGKFGLFNKKLAHYDFNFVVGVGLAGVERPDLLRKESANAYEPGLLLGTGFSIYLAQDWTARFDVRGFLVRGAESEAEKTFFKRLQFPVEFSLGASYLF